MSDKVGCWFSIGKEDAGIIRYHGSIEGTSGEWFGVEWSADSQQRRGKHSGTHGSHRYFQTSHSKGGSFIRPLLDRMDFGQSLLSAIHERYLSEPIGLPASIDSGNRGKLEAVGFEKTRREQSQLTELRVLGLDSLRVNGSTGDLSELKNVETLRLSGNYLTRWGQVDGILETLTRVRVLDVSGNHFESPMELAAKRKRWVDTVVLDSMAALQWIDVLRVAQGLNAREMSWGWSQAQGLASDGVCDCLEDLRLEYNQLLDITLLARQLPSLKSLNLQGNSSLDSLPTDDVCFPKLETLSLRATGITGWSTVELLDKVAPQLKTLHLYDTPLQQQCQSYDECRANIIARLPCLQKLDGTEISGEERTEMERYYLVLCSRQPGLGCSPRTKELVAKHGPPMPSKPIGSGLKSRLIKVTLQVIDQATGRIIRTQAKQLIRSMTLGQLRPMLSKLAGGTRHYQIYLQADGSLKTLDDWGKDLGTLLSNGENFILVKVS